MNNIRHISLDVWNTLVVPSMDFTWHRTRFLADLFEDDESFIKTQYTNVKKDIDMMAVDQGMAFSTDQCIGMLITQICDAQDRILESAKEFSLLHGKIKEHIAKMFAQYPPRIPSLVKTSLQNFHEAGMTMSISSNSSFIRGDLLEPYLRNNLGVPLLFHTYSDRLGYAKPSVVFFNRVFESASIGNRSVENKQQIFHIGSDQRSDGAGAQNVGMLYAVIKSPDYLLNTAIDIVGF